MLSISINLFASDYCNTEINDADSLNKNGKTLYGSEYFPLDLKKKLIYNSNFGDLELKVTKEKDSYTFFYDSDKFKYKQKLKSSENGLFIIETYQKIKVMLLVTKEGKYVYDKPLLRVPFPVYVGQEWKWDGKEFIEDETHTVNVKAKASKFETITTPAGKFEALKIETTLATSEGAKNIITEWYVKNLGMVKMKVSIEGGGMLGFARDILGYGAIEFDLKQIKDK